MNSERITEYIAAEVRKESAALAGLEAGPVNSSFIAHKLKEFYWTVTRLCGLGHLHKGVSPEALSLLNSKKNPLLFPAGARASGGGALAPAAPPGERLLIDVTDTLRCSFTSGIQRVVRQLAKAAMDSGAGIPVFIQDGAFFSYLRDSSAAERVEVVKGDKFIMADASWNDVPACRAAMEMTSRKGGANILILYDIHPLLYPGTFHPDTAQNFATWFDEIALKADGVVAISKSAAEEFLAYVAANDKPINRDMQIGWQHLGADFEIEGDQAPSQQVASLCSDPSPFFLSVSSLAPSKGYTVALNALDRLWASGVDVRYVIVGRYAWNTRALANRISSHPEYNKRLFRLEQVSAADLKHLYTHAHSLIFPSVAEGFGLPLIEAAHFGLTAIASDIPVFREIGGDAVSYFRVGDDASLAARLSEALARGRSADALPRVLRWQEAADGLLKLIRTNAYQFGHALSPHSD